MDKNEFLDDEKVQKVKEDVSAKIADAASEIKEEIDEAAKKAADKVKDAAETTADAAEESVEATAEASEESVEATAEASEESGAETAVQTAADAVAEQIFEKKPSKSVSLPIGALIGIIVGCVVVAALVVVLIMNYVSNQPKYGKAEGKTIATVNGEKITDEDLGYYIYAEAFEQYYNIEGEDADGDLTDFDWEQDVDGTPLSEIIKENAYNTAIDELIAAQKATELLNDPWTDDEDAQVESTVDGYVEQFGEDGFNLRAKSMGISSVNEYARMYKRVLQAQTTMYEVEENLDSYIPEGVDLSDYIQEDKATVKHVLIMVTDEADAASAAEEGEEVTVVDDATALATAQTVADLAKSGTDFDELMEQYNEDTGETTAGYTFTAGEMVEEFEDAAFALGIGEISEPVKSDYGYHVIMRLAGYYELQGYWESQATIKENKSNLDNISVKGIMDGVQQSGEELSAQQESAAAE